MSTTPSNQVIPRERLEVIVTWEQQEGNLANVLQVNVVDCPLNQTTNMIGSNIRYPFDAHFFTYCSQI